MARGTRRCTPVSLTCGLNFDVCRSVVRHIEASPHESQRAIAVFRINAPPSSGLLAPHVHTEEPVRSLFPAEDSYDSGTPLHGVPPFWQECRRTDHPRYEWRVDSVECRIS